MQQLIDNTPYVAILCAPPKSGKTHLIKYLLNEMFKKKTVKYGIVFCPSKFTGAYDFLPNEFVHSQYNENVLRKFYNIQVKQHIKNGKAEHAFVIFDDCIGSINFGSKFISKLISTYRHPNFTFIFATQYIQKIPSIVRECATYFITFRQTIDLSFTNIQKNYMADKTKKEVVKYIIENTKNYHFILVNTQEDEEKYSIEKVPKNYKKYKISY